MMPAPKGSYNAKVFQNTIVDAVEKKIVAVLSELARSRVVFQNITSLSDFLEPKVGRTSNRLRRQLRYRTLLEHHLSHQRGASSLITSRDRDVNVLRAKMKSFELEVARLLRDKAMLERTVANQLQGAGGAVFTPLEISKREVVDVDGPNSGTYRIAFERTAELLHALIQSVEWIEVDRKQGGLFDRSARPGEQQIAGANQTKWFIDWIKSKEH
jgi:hypothetical protein